MHSTSRTYRLIVHEGAEGQLQLGRRVHHRGVMLFHPPITRSGTRSSPRTSRYYRPIITQGKVMLAGERWSHREPTGNAGWALLPYVL